MRCERRLRLPRAAADQDFAAPAQPEIALGRRTIQEIPASADVAQLVEHFTRNEGVPGSSPGVGSGICRDFLRVRGNAKWWGQPRGQPVRHRIKAPCIRPIACDDAQPCPPTIRGCCIGIRRMATPTSCRTRCSQNPKRSAPMNSAGRPTTRSARRISGRWTIGSCIGARFSDGWTGCTRSASSATCALSLRALERQLDRPAHRWLRSPARRCPSRELRTRRYVRAP